LPANILFRIFLNKILTIKIFLLKKIAASNSTEFHFKHFTLHLSKSVMKVSTDSILLGSWANVENAINILDVGTGSGVLTLLLAQKCNANFMAIDVNEEAIKLAKQNFALSKWANQLVAVQSSFQSLQFENKFDVIISNPPYFQETIVSPKESRKNARHQVQLTFSELLLHTRRLLSKNGKAFFCIPYQSFAAFRKDAERQNLYVNQHLQVKATEAKTPYLSLLELQHQPLKNADELKELIIYNTQGTYTQAFKALTKDAYAENLH
jgi:tRNA1Val (adenine37-N6)-methyltransferase